MLADTLLEPICFASCYPCDVSTAELDKSEFKVFPVPAKDYVMIAIPDDYRNRDVEVVVFDNHGQEKQKELFEDGSDSGR